ncbi:MAG: TolC family protein [Bacteroidales bacterium]|nr:TolC family protein [Bacteroidales bacterium]
MMKIIRFSLLTVMMVLTGMTQAQQTQPWSLQACIDTALQNNIQMNQQRLNNRLTEINYEQSRAQRIPTLNASASQSYSFGRSIDPYTNQYNNNNFASNSFSMNSSLTLFNGFQIKNKIKQNAIDLKAGEKDLETLKKNVTLNVVLGYVQVLFAYDQLENARTKVSSTKAQVERTEKLVEMGELPESNLLQMQSQMATDHYAQVNAENQLWMSKVNLMQLMEIPVSAGFDVVRPQLPDSLDTRILTRKTDEIYQEALHTQPQVQSAALKVMSAEKNLEISRGAMYPRLSLSANLSSGYSNARSLYDRSYTTVTQEIGYLASDPTEKVLADKQQALVESRPYPFQNQVWDNFGQSVRLSLSIPIFNNKQVKTNIKRSMINIETARLNELTVKVQLRKEVEQAFSDLIVASKSFAAAYEQLRSARKSYLDVEKKYDLGLLNATDYLIEKNNYANAQVTLTRNKYDFIFKEKILDFYRGKPIHF